MCWIQKEKQMSQYDIAIIGSGPAGYTAAFEAVKNDLKTALIERDMNNIGGVCLNEGCIPLKGLLHFSAHIKDYGAIKETVGKKVDAIRSGLASRLKNGIDLIEGSARFVSKDEIETCGRIINSKYFMICTGSSPKRLFDLPNVYTSEKIFSIDKPPKKVLLIGGGVIGCEYASFFNNIGTDVTIVEILDSILFGEDDEAVRALAREFRKKKITVHDKSRVADIGADGTVTVRKEDGDITDKFDLIFETAGRAPNTGGLGLENAGVRVNGKGFIEVNDAMQTGAPNIYAAGDCIDTPMLAYTAYAEAEAAVNHIVNKTARPVNYAGMPKLVFSSPQAGSIGISEKTAGGSGGRYHIYKYFFKAIGKAAVEGKDSGFIKLIAENDFIIGASAVGEEIADIMNELSIIINNKIQIDDVRRCMHIHPSYSEIIIDALKYGG